MKEKIKDPEGLKSFCKQLWRELNENIWGKLIILFVIVYSIGNLIIRVLEFSRTIDLIFNIPLIAIFLFLSIIYTHQVLHKND